jgi:hypothetical protein
MLQRRAKSRLTSRLLLPVSELANMAKFVR